jgi:hypothetical protein
MCSTRICRDCQKFQNGICTEDGMFAYDGGSCEKWRYRYEPLVFAVERMRRVQKAAAKDWKTLQEQTEDELVVDRMLERIRNGETP